MFLEQYVAQQSRIETDTEQVPCGICARVLPGKLAYLLHLNHQHPGWQALTLVDDRYDIMQTLFS